MSAPPQKCNWRASNELYFRSWNDEFVVYHSRSGDTHLLGTAAGHILLALQQAPSDAIALSQSLASLPGIAPEEFMLQINDMLAELNALSLISVCRP